MLAIGILWALALRDGIGGDFFYDEAVYANLAEHPFRTDYYFDPLFFRHPPLVYLVNGLLERIVADVRVEVMFRTASLLAASVGLVCLWRALLALEVRRSLAGIAIIALASSPLFVRYSRSATMYPYAFCFVTILIDGLARRRTVQEYTALTLLLWTHYWGHLVIALHLGLLHSRGTPWRDILRRYRWALGACIPVFGLALAGFAYHMTRVRPMNLPGGWKILAFYVSLPTWYGLACSVRLVRTKRPAGAKQTTVVLCLAAAFSFVAISAVSPSYARYLYFFMPLFIVAGTDGIDQATRRMTPSAHRVLTCVLALLFFAPSNLFAAAEPRLFSDPYADDGRFEGWRQVVDLCSHERVLTDNGRSYAYYLSRHLRARLNLQDLQRAGALVQFDDAADLVRKVASQRPGCIAVDRSPLLPEALRFIETQLPQCARLSTAPTRTYQCHWQPPRPFGPARD
jgi:hypothetical protein